VFYACWTLIRVWLDPDTASKIKFVNYDQLDEYIDKDQICKDVGLSSEDLAGMAED
jgi:hypothetical protein